MALLRLMMAGSSASATYAGLMASASPQLWWKLEETSGTSAADSSANGFTGTLLGGSSFASAGVSVAAVSGYAGIGKGVDFSATGVNGIQSASDAVLDDGYGSTGAWTMVLWAAGSSGTNQYMANRANNMAMIYQYTTDTVEFFAVSFTGSDPRTGSGISLPASDTTTPHMIVYRYNNGNWSGFKDGTNVFNVSRSFGLGVGAIKWEVGGNGTTYSNSRIFDFSIIKSALSDAQILALWNARNA